ncbi:MAG: hypothetical protein ACFBSD_04665 [Paracoccaceae bacterium]
MLARSSFGFAVLVAGLAAASDRFPSVTIGDLVPGTAVSVSGTVQRVSDDDEFLLEDATGTVEVYLEQGGVTVRAGDEVTVRGVVDDDAPLEIYAQEVLRRAAD